MMEYSACPDLIVGHARLSLSWRAACGGGRRTEGAGGFFHLSNSTRLRGLLVVRARSGCLGFSRILNTPGTRLNGQVAGRYPGFDFVRSPGEIPGTWTAQGALDILAPSEQC